MSTISKIFDPKIFRLASKCLVVVALVLLATSAGSAREKYETIEAHAFGEAEPERKPPFALELAVLENAIVIVDAPDPLATKVGIVGPREDDGVFDGDPRLVVEAVDHPALQLLLREAAGVHAYVERVLVVVPGRPLAAERPLAVFRAMRLCERVARDVAGQQIRLPGQPRLGENDGEGIRFLSRGAAGAPGAQPGQAPQQ